MKTARCLAVLLAATSGGHASASLAPFGVRASTSKKASAPRFAPETQDVMLNLRGGASSQQEFALKAFQVLMGAHGIVAERAACKTPSLLYNSVFPDLEENTLAEFAMETVGTSIIGVVVMQLLSLHTGLSPTKIVAAGGVPCLLLGTKWLLQGKFDAAGFVNNFGYVYLASFLPLYPILKGMGDTDLLLKIFMAVPFVNGVVGWITGKAFYLKDPTIEDKGAMAVSGWMNSSLVMWAMLAYYILDGKDVYEAMKPIMTVWMVQLIDMNFVRKTNITGNEPTAFVAVAALLTYLFWVD